MKKDAGTRDPILPQRCTRDSRFTFQCHKDLSCFTKCCSDVKIILTPYDVLRLKQRLDMTSGDFLREFTHTEHLEKIGLPVPMLNMQEDEEKKCPFITASGCTVYSDRPATCRYYPLGFALHKKAEEKEKEEFFFFVREDHCLGFEEDREWTVQDWREDQEPELYDRMNRGWTEILIKKQTFNPADVPEKSLQLFYMVSYDVDNFRKFVFDSTFLKRYPINDRTAEKIKANEEQLMLFGLNWLNRVLFKK